MSTIDTNLLESLNLTQQSRQSEQKDTLGQDEFLKLMTTQLNNQDPLKPMEGGEFFTQIAQFSSVAGIQELQSSFAQVASAMNSSQALQASAMVGRSVLIEASEADLQSGQSISGSVELPSSTSNLTVDIQDAAGQLVRRMNLGPHAGGDIEFTWDGLTDNGGQAAAGRYQVRAFTTDGSESIAARTFLTANVDSVSIGGGGQGITLNLAGMGKTDLASVKQIK